MGRAFIDGPRIVADTQITIDAETLRGSSGDPEPYTRGVLKAVILHPMLCAAFAGTISTATDVLSDLGRRMAGGFDVEEVRRVLQRACRDDPGVEFMVATLAPESELFIVDDRGAQRGDVHASIGSSRAYSAYMKHFHTAGDLPRRSVRWREPLMPGLEQEAAARMLPAMVQVILDGGYPEVGGLPVLVAPTRRGFRYEPVAMRADAADGTPAASWGDASRGDFGYRLLVPSCAGVGAVGVYFPAAKLGVVYAPAELRDAPVFRDTTQDAFVEAVRDNLGIGLDAPPAGPDH